MRSVTVLRRAILLAIFPVVILLVNASAFAQSANQPPSCTLSVNPSTGYVPFDVFANGNCTDPENDIATTSLNWGDGTIVPGTTSQSHTYTTPGNYTVTVTATDTGGLSGSASQPVTAKAVPPPQTGDLYVGISSNIGRFDRSGGEEQSLRAKGNPYGLAFDSTGNLYAAEKFNGAIEKFDPNGNTLGTFGSGYTNPESLVFDAAGNAYLGDTSGGKIVKLNSSGTSFTSYVVAVESSNDLWVDLAPDQCTIFYTSAGKAVKRFDVCKSAQLLDFTSSALPGSMAEGLRVLPSGGILVADTDQLVRLNASGAVSQTYTAGAANNCNVSSIRWEDISLDPDGSSFWATERCSDGIYHFDIASGSLLNSFQIPFCDCSIAGGIAIRGEITAATSQPPSCTLALKPTSGSAPLTVDDTGSSCNPSPTTHASVTSSSINWGDGTSSGPSYCDGSCPYSGTHTYANAGTYNVVLSGTDRNGATATASKQVTVTAPVNQPPSCILSVNPQSGTPPFTVTATGNCTDPENDITNTTLDFGDGSPIQNGSSGTHTYQACGMFMVTVTATDSGGLSGSATQNVTSTPCAPPANGDVYVSFQDGGKIGRFRPDGTLIQTLDTGSRSTFLYGSAFDLQGNYYVTAFSDQTVYKFDTQGNLLGTFGSGYNRDPESITFDSAGNAYVGNADGNHVLVKLDPSGKLLATYSPARENRGTDWVDLAADQCTIYYTSEGTLDKRFNVCTNTQLSDFATGLPGPFAFAQRIRPNGEVIVADGDRIVRLNTAGQVITTYGLGLESEFFAANLDPDGTSFWTGGLGANTVYHFDISSGNLISKFTANDIGGISIRGEITVAKNPPPTCTLVLNPTTGQAPLTVDYSGSICNPGANSNSIVNTASISWGDGTPDTNADFCDGSCPFHGTHTYPNPGTYTVVLTGTDSNGNTGTASRTVTVTAPPPPTCNLSVKPQTAPQNSVITAQGLCSSPTLASVTLNWGDGTGVMQESNGSFFDQHRYTQVGSFTVTVTGTDAQGQKGSASQTVTIVAPTPGKDGDVYISVATQSEGLISNGDVEVHRPDGTLSQVLATNTKDLLVGLAFDKSRNLYVTDDQGNQVFKFDSTGTLLGRFGSGFLRPDSIAFDAAGNVYVGQQNTATPIVKFDATGTTSTNYSVATDGNGRWVFLALAADQCTMYYTTSGSTIKRFNVCTNTQLTDFVTGLTGRASGLRIRPNGEVILANNSNILRFNSAGQVLTTYNGDSTCFTDVSLDPDGSSFWASDQCFSSVFRFDIASGTILKTFTPSTAGVSLGIAVRGEITAALIPPPACTLTLNPTSGTAPLTVDGTGSNCTPSPSSSLRSASINWGDGTSSDLNCDGSCFFQGSHTFALPGVYTVTLTATDNNGLTGSTTKTVTATAAPPQNQPPTCTLSVNPASGASPLTVTANGNCTDPENDITSTSIDFGDGTVVQDSTSGTHTYTVTKTTIFTVTVSATDAGGLSGSASKTVTVSANQPPTCTLNVVPSSGNAPLTVTATGNCTDPENDITSTSLDFGDGTVVQGSTSGTHTYSKGGTFTITVSATDSSKLSGSASQAVSVSQPPTCTLTVTPTSGAVPLTVTATGSCNGPQNPIVKTTLDFGDGTILQTSSGTHTYNTPGNFTVVLTATDSAQLSASASQAVSASAAIPLVYVATAGGNIFGYTPDGKQAKTLNAGFAGSLTGMAFDAAGGLYVTGFTAAKVAKFDSSGNLQGTFGSGFNCRPESIVFDVAGNAYVGQAGCSHTVLKFDSSGNQIASFPVATENQGSDWIDLAPDQCTLFYTSEGHQILRYDVCRDVQLPVFTDQLHKGLAVRLLSDGGLLVADNVDIHRADASGKLIMTYDAPGEDCWVGLTLDPDGKSFWAADSCTSNVYKFAIDSGAQLFKLNTGSGPNTIFGLGMNAKSFQSTAPGVMTASPADASVAAGQAVNYSITIDPSAQTTGKTFNLTCTNLPAGASCTFAPPAVTVGTSNTSTLTIHTTAPTVGALRPAKPGLGRLSMAMLALLSLPIAGLLLVSVSSKKRFKAGYVALVLMGLLLISGSWLSGCGGSQNNTKTFAQASTPAGKYTVLVVGVSGSTQTTTPITLTVH